jgi:hypothetical protein
VPEAAEALMSTSPFTLVGCSTPNLQAKIVLKVVVVSKKLLQSLSSLMLNNAFDYYKYAKKVFNRIFFYFQKSIVEV